MTEDQMTSTEMCNGKIPEDRLTTSEMCDDLPEDQLTTSEMYERQRRQTKAIQDYDL